MTVVASSASSTLNSAEKFTYNSSDTEDSLSQSSNDDSTLAIQTYNPPDALVQCLGYPEDPACPRFGQVSVENSTDVHFGDKNFYQGPVTIKQIVYANGSPAVGKSELGGKDNVGFEGDCDTDLRKDCATLDVKASDLKNCDKKTKEGTSDRTPGPSKDYKWLQHLVRKRPIEAGVFLVTLLIFVVVLTTFLILKHSSGKATDIVESIESGLVRPVDYDPDISVASQIKNKLRIISRYQWVAQPPNNVTTPLVTPVPYVIIHHTATANCSSQAQCVLHVRLIQTFHMESNGFFDIGYNFLVGGDGAAYEGRGWNIEGAHLYGYNARSIGIAFIGTFIHSKPPDIQILACKKLIELGVEQGFIRKDYKLLAARQLSATESPGTALFEDIKTWPHWAKEP